MTVQYATIERKHAPLHSDFARDFVRRRFGDHDAALIYLLLPTYSRGQRKGLSKGYVHWDKVTVGGWVRDANGRGHVERPGIRNVRITANWDYESAPAIAETRRYENETDADRKAYIRELLSLMFGKQTQLRGIVPAVLSRARDTVG